MRDYRYFDLVTQTPEWEECLSAIQRVRAEALQQVADAFGTNLQRISDFSIMPAEISGMALQDGHLSAYAMHEATGQLVPSLIEQFSNNESAAAKYYEI